MERTGNGNMRDCFEPPDSKEWLIPGEVREAFRAALREETAKGMSEARMGRESRLAGNFINRVKNGHNAHRTTKLVWLFRYLKGRGHPIPVKLPDLAAEASPVWGPPSTTGMAAHETNSTTPFENLFFSLQDLACDELEVGIEPMQRTRASTQRAPALFDLLKLFPNEQFVVHVQVDRDRIPAGYVHLTVLNLDEQCGYLQILRPSHYAPSSHFAGETLRVPERSRLGERNTGSARFLSAPAEGWGYVFAIATTCKIEEACPQGARPLVARRLPPEAVRALGQRLGNLDPPPLVAWKAWQIATS